MRDGVFVLALLVLVAMAVAATTIAEREGFATWVHDVVRAPSADPRSGGLMEAVSRVPCVPRRIRDAATSHCRGDAFARSSADGRYIAVGCRDARGLALALAVPPTCAAATASGAAAAATPARRPKCDAGCTYAGYMSSDKLLS